MTADDTASTHPADTEGDTGGGTEQGASPVSELFPSLALLIGSTPDPVATLAVVLVWVHRNELMDGDQLELLGIDQERLRDLYQAVDAADVYEDVVPALRIDAMLRRYERDLDLIVTEEGLALTTRQRGALRSALALHAVRARHLDMRRSFVEMGLRDPDALGDIVD